MSGSNSELRFGKSAKVKLLQVNEVPLSEVRQLRPARANVIKLFLFVIYEFLYYAKVFVFDKYCQPILMFVGKARSLLLSGASERCFIHLGSNLTSKHSRKDCQGQKL
jgi:hypothetical protein